MNLLIIIFRITNKILDMLDELKRRHIVESHLPIIRSAILLLYELSFPKSDNVMLIELFEEYVKQSYKSTGFDDDYFNMLSDVLRDMLDS